MGINLNYTELRWLHLEFEHCSEIQHTANTMLYRQWTESSKAHFPGGGTTLKLASVLLWWLQLLRLMWMAAARASGLSKSQCLPLQIPAFSPVSVEDVCKLRTQSFAHQEQQFTSLKIFGGQSPTLRLRHSLTCLVSMWNLNTGLFYYNIESSNLKEKTQEL